LIPTWSIHFILDFEHFRRPLHCEEVYMEQPPNFVAQGEFSSLVCWLRKSLYGLKQSLQAWFGKFQHCNFITLCFIGIMHQIQYFMRRPSTLRLIVNFVKSSDQLADISPSPSSVRVLIICNKLGTWIVCTSLRGSVRIWIGLYNPIRIGIGLYNPIRIGIGLYNPIRIGIGIEIEIGILNSILLGKGLYSRVYK